MSGPRLRVVKPGLCKFTVETRWETSDGMNSDYVVHVTASSVLGARYAAILKTRQDFEIEIEIEDLEPGEKILIRAMYKGHLKNLMSETGEGA